jgi:hypothetical protein
MAGGAGCVVSLSPRAGACCAEATVDAMAKVTAAARMRAEFVKDCIGMPPISGLVGENALELATFPCRRLWRSH